MNLKKLPSMWIVTMFLLMSVIVINPFNLILNVEGATSYTSAQNGDWDTVTSWTPNGNPGTTDDVTIVDGHQIYIVGDVAIEVIDIVHGDLIIDAVGSNSNITITIDDTAGAGFGASKGNFTCNGSAEYNVTITSASATPSNYWDFRMPTNVTANHTTFEGYASFQVEGGDCNINNCTFRGYSILGVNMNTGTTVTDFSDNYIDHNGLTTNMALNVKIANIIIQNVTIVNVGTGAYDVKIDTNTDPLEFINSSFDPTNIDYWSALGWFISKNHNDTIDSYYINVGSLDTGSASKITNLFNITDDVTLVTGIFNTNIQVFHANMTLKNGATLLLGNKNHTINASKTITVESGATYDATAILDSEIVLKSDNNGTQWFFDAQSGGTVLLEYVDVKDCNASLGETMVIDDTGIDSGNNVNWVFLGNLTYTNGKGGDYDPQVFRNDKGQIGLFSAFDGDDGYDSNITMRYSDDGINWSDQIILFSDAYPGTGIIDNNWGGQWEFSVELHNDIVYCAFHLYSPLRIAFTKCDVTEMSNMATYSNWKSANDVAVPSLGGGTNGSGYDILSGAGNGADPSIAVKSHDDILVVWIDFLPTMLMGHWNGSVWNLGTVKTFPYNTIMVPRASHTQDGDWVVLAHLHPGDNNDYIVAMRCENGNNPMLNASWTGFNGSDHFDYAIDTGGKMFWGVLQVDSNNNVHVVAISDYGIGGFNRLFHNYWNGTAWVYNETENNAGIQVNFSDNPKMYGESRRVNLNADSGGNIIACLVIAKGPGYGTNGIGLYSLIWNGTDWNSTTFTKHGGLNYQIVSEGFMRRYETTSPFLLAEQSRGTGGYLLNVPNAVSGNPWWDSLYNINLIKDIWNFKGYPSETSTNAQTLLPQIPNCICLIGKNLTTEYWYTYWPSIGFTENFEINFGDGLFILTTINTTWQVSRYTGLTDIPQGLWVPVVYSGITNSDSQTIYSSLTNITCLIGKNETQDYWYTYAPSWGILENHDISFGDGLFMLATQDTTWDHI